MPLGVEVPAAGYERNAVTADQGDDEHGLRIDAVTVRFGGLTALEDVSLQVSPGEVVGVIGPNGAGKTTLFNVICGFVRPDGGDVVWRGRSLGAVRPHQLARLGIARTLQGVGLFAGLPRSDRDERALRAGALDALDALGVADVAARLPGTLPFPIQKRVALARALVARPQLILLDEPAGGLGGEDMRDLGERIRGLGGEMAVLLVEHHMDLVMSASDRVVVLDFGRRIAEGTPDEVRSDQRVLDAYLGVEVDAPG
jgi:branched-chain amino acid transport system ATP-binding protein